MMISGWVGLVQSWGFAEHQLPNGGKFEDKFYLTEIEITEIKNYLTRREQIS